MESEICKMKDISIMVIVCLVCITILGLSRIAADSASQHGEKNRALIQLCIENNKRPVIAQYGVLESCE